MFHEKKWSFGGLKMLIIEINNSCGIDQHQDTKQTVCSPLQHHFSGTLHQTMFVIQSYSKLLSKLNTHYFNIAFYNHIIC